MLRVVLLGLNSKYLNGNQIPFLWGGGGGGGGGGGKAL